MSLSNSVRIPGMMKALYALVWVLGAPVVGVAAGAGSPVGVVTYQVGGILFRVEATPLAVPENLSEALDSLSAGPDEFVNVSPDGRWLLISTERFGCGGWACLVVVAADLSSAAPILVPMSPDGFVHSDSFSAIASGGDLVVFTSNDGPHAIDLWAVSRNGGNWRSPILLTELSGHDYNEKPAISDSGASVVFDCGPVPHSQEETGICVVDTDGADFSDVLAFNGPDAPAGTLLIHHPDFAPDGSIVVEIDTGTETIWRLPGGSGPPVQITDEFENDNSPCVLPDGRIASLWLNAPDNPAGFHELKVMDASGSNSFRAVVGVDVADAGIGCGGATDAIFASGFETGVAQRE